jgi:hypothetical protein
MKMPNADKAVIAAEKLRDYLLNLDHRRGGTKAKLLYSFGYRRADWRRLENDLRDQHLDQEVAQIIPGEYGMRYDIVAPIKTPHGRQLLVRTIWQIDTGTTTPRLITMVPEDT